MDNNILYKYANLEYGTRIFFKGDEKDPSCLGTIVCETMNGYVISMDNNKKYIVHPVVFEDFWGTFQVEEEREAKLTYLSKN